MKPTLRSIAVIPLLMCTMTLCSKITSAQEADVDVIAPSRITQSLISRKELNRLINQPPQDRNPLRRTTPATENQRLNRNFPTASPILKDPYVRPTAWQDSQIQATEDPADAHATDTNPADASVDPTTQPPAIAPMHSFEMESLLNMFGILVEIPIDKLQREIASRRAALDTSAGIDDETRTLRLEQIEVAESAAQQAILHAASKDELQQRMINLEADLARLREQTKKTVATSPIDRSIAIETMEVRLRDLQAAVGIVKSNIGKIQNRIQQRDSRMKLIPTEKLQSRQLANELHQEYLEKQSSGSEDIEVLLSLRAKELAASTKAQKLEVEDSWHDQSQEKLPLEKTIQQLKLQQLEQEINDWNKAIADRKRIELEQQIQLASQKEFDAHPDLQELLQETTKLAQARADLAKKFVDLQQEQLKVGKQSEEVERQFSQLESSIGDTDEGHSSELLIEVHRNLIRPYEGMARVQKIASEKKLARGAILKLRAEQERIADSETFIREMLQIGQDQPVDNVRLFKMAKESVSTHNEQLIALEQDYEAYQKLLNAVGPEREQLLKDIAATRELVDTHALWIQSADPFSIELISQSAEGAKEFFDYQQWRDLGQSIYLRIKLRPYECVVGLMGLIVALVVGRRFKG